MHALNITSALERTIANLSDYKGHPDGVLTSNEVQGLVAQVEAGLRSTEGDAATCTVSARQLALLLKAATADQDATWRALLNFVLDGGSTEQLEFLRAWREGNFEACRRDWPEAPENVYPDQA